MLESLDIKEIKDDKIWDKFIFSSENKNIFSTSEFIENFKFEKKKFFIKKKEEILASFHLFVKGNEIYRGDNVNSAINFKKFDKVNNSSLIYKKFYLIQKFTNFLVENYKKGELVLDHHTNDVRPFYWYNFDSKKEFFRINTNFTSIIDIGATLNNLKNLEISSFYKNLSRSIKQQLNKTKKEKIEIREETDFDLAISLIRKTFERQNQKVNFNIESLFYVYKKLSKKNSIKMYVSSKDKIDTSFTIFGVIGEKATYLNGGRLIDSNNDYSLTFNLINSLFYLKKNGVHLVDLEGVNSPNRGFWKLGFGGGLVPYYKISFRT